MKKNERRLSAKEGKKLLGDTGKGKTDEEVKQIMNVMWNCTELEFENFVKTNNHE